MKKHTLVKKLEQLNQRLKKAIKQKEAGKARPRPAREFGQPSPYVKD